MNIKEVWEGLPREQKFFLIALGGVSLYALYVRSKRLAQAQAAQQDAQTASPSPVVTTGQESANFAGALSDAVSQLSKGQTETQQGISALIASSNDAVISGLNNQGKAISDAITATGTANGAALAALQQAENDTGKSLLDAFKTGNQGLSDAFKAASDGLAAKLEEFFTGQVSDIKTSVAQSVTAVNGLQALITASQDTGFLTLGAASAASCFSGGPDSAYDTCVDNKIGVDNLGTGVAGGGGSGRRLVYNFYKGKGCWDDATGSFDKKCVGKVLAGVSTGGGGRS